MNTIEKNGLKISSTLYEFVNNEALPGTNIKPEDFWKSIRNIINISLINTYKIFFEFF